MRMLKFLLLIPFMFVPACDSDPILPIHDAIRQADVIAPPIHKVKLVTEGTGQPIGWCAPGVVHELITGTGTATGSGHFQVTQTACLNLTTGAVTDGVATLIAANGDELYMSWTGQARASTPTTFDMTYIVIGGTGRYLNAQGVIEVVVEHPTPGTFTAGGNGWLSLYASDRSDN